MSTNTENDPNKSDNHHDGIVELDNKPPHWFMLFFYATIAIGVIYFIHYTMGSGESIMTEYQRDHRANEIAVFEEAKRAANRELTEEDLQKIASDNKAIELGKVQYQAKCAACHGGVGEGSIGPNLTDKYWIHGGKLTQVLGVIRKGVLEKGMPAWGGVLSADESTALVAYIHSLSGSNPPNAKAPQGELVP